MSVNLFKSSVGGYNKAEVDTYIHHISHKMEREKKDYERRIEILEAEITKLNNEKTEIEALLKEDEAIIGAFRSQICDDQAAAEKFVTPDEETTENVFSEATEILEKSKRYDEISRQLGEIIIKANADAAEIVRDAKAEAAAIKAAAADEIKRTADHIAEKLCSIAKDAQSTLSTTGSCE